MYYDLHIHSCLSPCGDDDMTPNNIVNMAMLNGLDLIALTDHNTTRNCAAAMAVGREVGVVVVPGMELTTAEDIHVVCLFPNLEAAESFDRYVYGCLPPIPNRAKIFGEQRLCDCEDNVIGLEERLLITATSIGLDDVPELVDSYGGVALLAHIDRKSNGALAILGSLSEDLGFSLAEVSKLSRPDDYGVRFPFLTFIGDSDAHLLTDIAECGPYNEISATFTDAADVVEYFRKIAKK